MGTEQLGRYTVLQHLASGGMADVLLARADGIEGFERHVVLKRIRPEFAKDKLFIRMFLDEARIAATLHHQAVVQVHDIGEVDGEYFFAMEYIHGEDVRRILQEAALQHTYLPFGMAVAIASGVAAGLHYAHERRGADKQPLGIVHRDVSLSNILVGYDGSVKVVDFGIAKAAMRTTETRSGNLKGKVSYMSPEQCRGGTLDRRSDIYSLGVVLYELVTTSRLFKGSDYDMMSAIVHGDVPPPQTRRADVPDALARIIERALAADPVDRFQTAADMRAALEQFARHENLATSPADLAAYMLETFGERLEPWLEPRTDSDAPALGEAAGEQPTGSGGQRATSPPLTVSETDLPVPAEATGELSRSQRPQLVLPGRKRRSAKKLAIYLAPLMLAGPVTLYFAARPSPRREPPPMPHVAAASPPAPAPAPAPEPAPNAATVPLPGKRSEPKPAHASPVPRRPTRTEPPARGEDRLVAAAPAKLREPPVPPPAPTPPPLPAPSPIAVPSPPPAPPAPVGLEPRVTGVEVQGSLSQAIVTRAVSRVAAVIQRCAVSGAARTVDIHFTIDESRRAQNVRGGNAPPCIVAAFAGIRTEASPDVGDVEVTVKVALEPRT